MATVAADVQFQKCNLKDIKVCVCVCTECGWKMIFQVAVHKCGARMNSYFQGQFAHLLMEQTFETTFFINDVEADEEKTLNRNWNFIATKCLNFPFLRLVMNDFIFMASLKKILWNKNAFEASAKSFRLPERFEMDLFTHKRAVEQKRKSVKFSRIASRVDNLKTL
jgi:hypothetical protein